MRKIWLNPSRRKITNPLKFVGREDNYLNPTGKTYKGGSIRNATRTKKPFQFEDVELILEAIKFDESTGKKDKGNLTKLICSKYHGLVMS
jgi:hypothetical protein